MFPLICAYSLILSHSCSRCRYKVTFFANSLSCLALFVQKRGAIPIRRRSVERFFNYKESGFPQSHRWTPEPAAPLIASMDANRSANSITARSAAGLVACPQQLQALKRSVIHNALALNSRNEISIQSRGFFSRFGGNRPICRPVGTTSPGNKPALSSVDASTARSLKK